MFNTLIQLYIERRLSGAKPYLASHPDLGVPLGIFNYKDEPNKDARIKSIKKYGVKGNPYSYRLAKKYGIKNPIPSYQSKEELEEENRLLRERIELLQEAQFFFFIFNILNFNSNCLFIINLFVKIK